MQSSPKSKSQPQQEEADLELRIAEIKMAIRRALRRQAEEKQRAEQKAILLTQQALAVVEEGKRKEQMQICDDARKAQRLKEIQTAETSKLDKLKPAELDKLIAQLTTQLAQAASALAVAQQNVVATSQALQASTQQVTNAMQQIVTNAQSQVSASDGAMIGRAASRLRPVAEVVRVVGEVNANVQLANLGLRIVLEPSTDSLTQQPATNSLPSPRPEFAALNPDEVPFIDISGMEDELENEDENDSDNDNRPADFIAAAYANIEKKKAALDATLNLTPEDYKKLKEACQETNDNKIEDNKAREDLAEKASKHARVENQFAQAMRKSVSVRKDLAEEAKQHRRNVVRGG